MISGALKNGGEYFTVHLTFLKSSKNKPHFGNENDGYSITFNAAFQTQQGNRNYKPIDWLYQLGIN